MDSFNFENIKIGVDIAEVSRFEQFDEKSRLTKNIFTSREIEECSKKTNPAESLAARFAAKEAVKKTVGENIKFNEIEISNDKSGAPYVVFLDKEIKNKYKSIISMSHIKSIAQAICITYKNHE